MVYQAWSSFLPARRHIIVHYGPCFSCSDFFSLHAMGNPSNKWKRALPVSKSACVYAILRGWWEWWIQESGGLLTRQMGMFSFGFKEFHWDRRQGSRLNNVRMENGERESMGFLQSAISVPVSPLVSIEDWHVNQAGGGGLDSVSQGRCTARHTASLCEQAARKR